MWTLLMLLRASLPRQYTALDKSAVNMMAKNLLKFPIRRNSSLTTSKTISASTKFEVVPSGLGSLLSIKLSRNDHIFTIPRGVIGLSGNVKTGIHIEDNPKNNIGRKLGGGPLILNKVQSEDKDSPNSEVLIAPPRAGDIAIVDIDPSKSSFNIRRGSLLASSSNVKISTVYDRSFGSGLISPTSFILQTSGLGKLALFSSGGSAFYLSLAEGEEYCVDPSYLLAWSSTIKPKPLAETEVKIDKLLSSVSFSTFIQYWMINRMKVISHTAYSKFRSWIFGEKDSMYLLSGPGEFYISSRREPKFRGLVNTYSALSEIGEKIREDRKYLSQKLRK